MTDIIVGPRVEDPLSDIEPVASSGYVRVRPSRVNTGGGQWVMGVWSEPVTLTGSPLTFKLDALTDIPYEMHVHLTDGQGGDYDLYEFRTVTASGVPLKWEDLVLANGPGAAPVIPGDLDARVAALEAAILSVSGGASTVAGITDMSAPARTFNQQSSYTAMRTTLGAVADTDVVHDTGSETVDGVKTFTSSPVVPTTPTTAQQAASKSYVDTAVSGVVAGSVAWGGVTGKPATFPPTLPIATSGVTNLDSTIETTPWLLFTSGGAYPARPATPRSVWFMDPAVQPANDGLLAGGGGMYPLVDIWLSG